MKRHLRQTLPWLVPALVLIVAVAIGSRGTGTPSVQGRVRHLASELRCPTCSGQSMLDSDAVAAQAGRAEIERRVRAGQSDAEIRAYFVDTYGGDILMAPRSQGIDAVVWILPVALVVCALAGLVVLFRRWRPRRRETSATPDEIDRVLVSSAGNVEEHEFIVRSLRDLDQERAAGDISDSDYRMLVDEYVGRAAVAAREEAGEGDRRDDRPSRPRWRIAAIAVGVIVAGVTAGELLARAAGERVQGQSISGSIARAPGTDVAQALALFQSGKAVDAIRLLDARIAQDPTDPEALAYRGWIVRLAGRQAQNRQLIDDGMAYVDRAIAADASYPDAHLFKGLMLVEDRSDPAGAVSQFEAFLADNPPADEVAMVQGQLDAAKAAVRASSGSLPAGVSSTTAVP